MVSPGSYNRRARLCVACPITNRGKGYPFEVAIPDGCNVTGVVLADQMRNLAWSERNATLIDHGPTELLEDVREKIAALIDI